MNAILSAAADLLEQPNAWTQEALARDAEGKQTQFPETIGACQWCTIGAIEKVAGGYNEESVAARIALREHLNVFSVAVWNDKPERTQAEVVAALRRAAK